jgi:glycosyltransferase involved in cell wall biosynthesis
MTTAKKRVSLISPCFNEEANIEELYRRVREVMERSPQYDFEYLFIDNASTDRTLEKLRKIAEQDSRVKIIVNTRNFGHLRSPYWGIIQTSGDVTVYMASDLQDPPELIQEFLAAWEQGYKVVLAVKPVSQTNPLIHRLRKLYYRFLDAISEVSIVKDATGFGLYDRVVLDKLREIHDPYPYMRGLICELGYPIKTIPFDQPRRLRGVSKNNAYTLYDLAMLGIVSHSVVPIRLAAMVGFPDRIPQHLGGVGVPDLEIGPVERFSSGDRPDRDWHVLHVWCGTVVYWHPRRIYRFYPHLCAQSTGSRGKRTDQL